MKKIIALVVVVLLVVGAVALIKKRKAQDASQPVAKIYPVVVGKVHVAPAHVVTTLPYLAKVASESSLDVASRYAGRIEKIASLGVKVKKGDLLVQIDSSDLLVKRAGLVAKLAALKQTLTAQKVKLQNLLRKLSRTKALVKVKMASKDDFENLQSAVAMQKAAIEGTMANIKNIKAQLKGLKNDLSYTKIYAPQDGVVAQKFLNVGDVAQPLRPILKLVSDRKYLLIKATDAKAIFYNGEPLPLQPLHTATGALQLFKAPLGKSDLSEGHMVNVRLITFDGNATLVPLDAILSIGEKSYVFKTDGTMVPIHIVASGEEGVVTKELGDADLIKAAPDILLKIKSGYPFMVRK